MNIETKIELKVYELVQNILCLDNQEKIYPNTRLVDLGADSLDMMELMITIEEEFDLGILDATIPDNEESLTIRDLVNLTIKEIRKKF